MGSREVGSKYVEKVVELPLEKRRPGGDNNNDDDDDDDDDASAADVARLELRCDWGVGIGGGLWAAGLLLSRHIAARSASCYGGGEQDGGAHSLSMRGKRVLELGSGTGLLGLAVAASCAPAEVVITDLESHCDLIRFNCARWAEHGSFHTFRL